MAPSSIQHVFLDLDGTLTESSVGIFRCLTHALDQLGHPAPPARRLVRCIGPSLAQAFRMLLGTDDAETIERAIAAYRERYEEIGIFECALYPGTRGALDRLAGEGRALRVVTAKPSRYAERIVSHFSIDDLVGPVHGPSLDAREYGKAGLVADALAAAGADPARTVMVGDRAEDVAAARAHGVQAVRAAWGYGEPDEFASTPPDFVARSLSDVARWIEAG